jgi:hypothetical protein
MKERNKAAKKERNKREIERNHGKVNKRNERNGPYGCRGRSCSCVRVSALTETSAAGCYVTFAVQCTRRMHYRYFT